MRNKSGYYLTGNAGSKIHPIRELCWQWLDDFIKENIEMELKNLASKRYAFGESAGGR